MTIFPSAGNTLIRLHASADDMFTGELSDLVNKNLRESDIVTPYGTRYKPEEPGEQETDYGLARLAIEAIHAADADLIQFTDQLLETAPPTMLIELIEEYYAKQPEKCKALVKHITRCIV